MSDLRDAAIRAAHEAHGDVIRSDDWRNYMVRAERMTDAVLGVVDADRDERMRDAAALLAVEERHAAMRAYNELRARIELLADQPSVTRSDLTAALDMRLPFITDKDTGGQP